MTLRDQLRQSITDEPVLRNRLRQSLGEQKELPIGLFENIRRTDIIDVLAKAPFSPYRGAKETGFLEATKRIKKDDYSKYETAKYEMTPMGGYTMVRPPRTKKEDIKFIQDYQSQAEEESRRGYTMPALIGKGIAELPSWMGEIYAGGGVSKGHNILRRALEHSALQPHRLRETLTKIELNEPETQKGTSFAKAWGRLYFENLSELTGEYLIKGTKGLWNKLPFGKKFIQKLSDAWVKLKPNRSVAQFLNRIGTQSGYHGLLAEIGEERVNTLLQSITGVDDFGAGKDASPLERLKAGMAQDVQNMPIEIAVLSVPGITKYAVGKALTPFVSPQEAITPTKPTPTAPKAVSPAVEPENLADRVAELIDAAKPSRAETETLKHKELSKRVGRAKGILKRGKGKIAFLSSTKALKGQLPTADFEPINVSEQEKEAMYEQIHTADEEEFPYFTKLNTAKALIKVFDEHRIPTLGEIELLENMFGTKIAKSLMKKRPASTRMWETALDIVNLPKAFVASFDASATLRQGFYLGIRYPRQWIRTFVPAMKAMFSEKAAAAIDKQIKSSPYAELHKSAKLYIAPRTQASAIPTAREERFMSRFTHNIPGLKHSERHYTSFLNKLRADVFDYVAKQWEGQGKTVADYRKLAKFINHSTGRGSLGGLNEISGILNAAFFSPRFVASRFQMPLDVFTRSKAMRRIAAQTLVRSIGLGLMILGLAKLGGADVEDDPRSSDFGKIKIKDTRIDFWAGHIQLARFIAQLIMGQRKSTKSGKVRDINRLDVVGNFLRYKLSPVAGLGVDLLAGKTAMGEEMTLTTETLQEQTIRRIVPIFIQDIMETVKYQGAYMLPLTAPLSFFGVGTQTYTSDKKGKYDISQRGK
jgi:hypothetical protein